jgi:endo-1,3-1,4-beta-glycanase ExoK
MLPAPAQKLPVAQALSGLLLLLGLGACGPDTSEALSLEQPGSTIRQELGGSSLSDDFNTYDSNTWWKANGYGNGGVFNVGWRSSNATLSNGALTLTLNDSGCPASCSGYPYTSSEYRTHARYGYGYYEVRMKPASGSGVISSFFVYDDASQDEVDIEFLGKDTTKMHTNYLDNGTGGHETVISLGFDAAASYHTYAFLWGPGFIEWFVDGVKVHGEYGARGPLPTHPGRIMMNLWTGIGLDAWAGSFQYTGPRTAAYDTMSWDAY